MLNKKIFLFILILIISVPSLFSQEENMMSITVKKAQVRTAPSFLGKIIYNLDYADRVEVFDEKKGWFLVGSSNFTERGWIHSSALIKKKIVLKATNTNLNASVTGSEVALAGKGFNKEVEAAYKNNNDMDYTWIDKMETYGVEIEVAIAFLIDGDIIPQEAE